MNKTEFANALATKLGITKTEAARNMDAFIGVLKEVIGKDEIIRIAGFGTIKTVITKARRVRNPRTGDHMDLKERKKVKYIPSKAMNLTVNKESE